MKGKTLPLLSLFLATMPLATVAVEYRPGWHASGFFEQVTACRAAIVLPEISGYEKKAKAAGHSDDATRNATVAMMPVFEDMASTVCYCALNELAKDITYESYQADQAKMRGYLDGAKCRAATADRMRAIKEHAIDQRLK